MHKNEMTLTVTAYGKTVTITQPDDIDIHTFLDTCRNLALSIEYADVSWKDAIIEMANEYLEDEERTVNNHLDEVLAQHPQKVYTGKTNLTTHWGTLGMDGTEC